MQTGRTGQMRRAMSALFYLLMVAFGAWLFGGSIKEGGRIISALAGGLLVLFGLYVLWDDFWSGERL